MKELKVQFGCGSNRLPDFENWDYEVDIRKNLPYGDNTVDFVIAEHVAEHLSGPDVLHFFEQVYRILKPGGVFRVCMPVIENLNGTDAKGIIRLHGHLTIWNAELIQNVLFVTARWTNIVATGRSPLDGHHKVIGIAKDDEETSRWEATK